MNFAALAMQSSVSHACVTFPFYFYLIFNIPIDKEVSGIIVLVEINETKTNAMLHSHVFT